MVVIALTAQSFLGVIADSLPSTGDDYILSSLSLPPLVRVVIAAEQPDSGDVSDSMSVMEGQNKEDFPDSPADLSKDDKEKSEVVEATEGKDKCGPKWQGSSEEEEDISENGERETWMPVTSRCQPSPPLSPRLLDLSLKRTTASICESGPHTSEDSTGIKANLRKTVQGHKCAEKRKMTDSSEVLRKRPAASPQTRSGVSWE